MSTCGRQSESGGSGLQAYSDEEKASAGPNVLNEEESEKYPDAMRYCDVTYLAPES